MATKKRSEAWRDAHLNKMLAMNPNTAIPYFLMASYLYYQKDISMFSDVRFDALCKWMESHWHLLTHQHKHLITLEDLRAGTGFGIKEYPGMAIGAAERLATEWGLMC